jgi:hypothetical protein
MTRGQALLARFCALGVPRRVSSAQVQRVMGWTSWTACWALRGLCKKGLAKRIGHGRYELIPVTNQDEEAIAEAGGGGDIPGHSEGVDGTRIYRLPSPLRRVDGSEGAAQVSNEGGPKGDAGRVRLLSPHWEGCVHRSESRNGVK